MIHPFDRAGKLKYDDSMKQRVTDAVLISLFTALTVVGAFIKIPIPYVPLTLQTMMVMFAGLILGSRRGALSQVFYLALGLLGLPIFAQGGGPAYILQPSFGFLPGFVAGAYVIGKIMEDERNPTLPRILAALILGQIAIYALGITYLHLNLNYILHKPVSFQTVLQIGMLVFLPGDILKTAVAALVVAPIRHRLISAVHP
jgi:biotin transport system substrate-specific component